MERSEGQDGLAIGDRQGWVRSKMEGVSGVFNCRRRATSEVMVGRVGNTGLGWIGQPYGGR
jgi:hypothetical protein